MKMKNISLTGLILVTLLLFDFHRVSAQGSVVTIRNGEFMQHGKVLKIHSGEMHYSRIPKPYWRHRLQMLKAMGMNTVATYVFWNYHEVSPGVWDFKIGNRDLAGFIKLAGEEGLNVILRPGPYICGEWENGGFPWWLQNNPKLKLRTDNEAFLDSCKTYFAHLHSVLDGLFANQGGPIILVQVENEFGSYVAQQKEVPLAEHKAYKMAIFQLLKDAGFPAPYFTADGDWLFDGGAIPGVLPAANGENDIDNLKKAVDKYHNGIGPYMVAEFYPGWLDHWGEPFVRVGTKKIVEQTKKYLDNGISFNFYMVHGGTNFGFTSGANYNDKHDIQPDLTSYDYDAPISEPGWATPKYLAIRKVMQQYKEHALPDVPAKIAVIKYPFQSVKARMDVLNWLTKQQPVGAEQPRTFEELEQGYGYVLYQKKFSKAASGDLKVEGLRDFAVVYVNGKKVGELDRVFNKYSLPVQIPAGGTLSLLVENMGRINYGAELIHNKKGIISPVSLNGSELTGNWEMYKMPLSSAPKVKNGRVEAGRPVFCESAFKVDKPADTFLDMSDWGKGIVFVNGHNLGRYWNIGPQHTLYVPGCWLKKGTNQIVIFEQLADKPHSTISFTDKPILEEKP